ncbi:dipeptide/oligopeptide/nickel ABC transporter ATP-binding protein [Nocardiopsis terrae]|uniref:ABC-type dipeptide/oligopeptide/nickel transport system ATPase component/ABC-type dipeptide/oligopeptide/nickel transport system permease subunit n=1 Tax=Nocardiopsis terrae TaxID=372655 RepID=A0ABR9HES9_9ACTN|nr:dipeptide/oligopeptide/nickel ABC transporter permease/ATP-binding protein [Nocardiopsis terrae]MBE1457533.1 ABC-type dipeptide/oligopeptide/nickel transport system ATPase component/ABC-type dipeptide/oligopeptide/nickel transport system permease subunit [Nocardiopsis terrae]GHC85596.1 dipeptide/oligopeptide/nickel ABC transporter ATP-binding protein [Nocardiopsis terrae]
MTQETAARRHAPGRGRGLPARLLANPATALSLAFLFLVTLVVFGGEPLAPRDPNHSSLHDILVGPGGDYPLGTDGAGRDVLSRLLVATRISVLAALLALAVALLLGVAGGMLAGYYGGWFDTVSTWLTSLVMSLPAIVVLLAARAVLGPSVWLSMAIFGVILSPVFFRLVYSLVSSVREELYVDAARVSGLGDARILGRHILAVVRAPIIIQAAIVTSTAIAIQSGLEFLGLGDPSVPTWGSMLNEGFANIYRAPMLLLWPAVAIALTSVALAVLANTLRDELEGGARPAGGPQTAEDGPRETAHAPVRHRPEETGTGRELLSVRGLRVGYRTPAGVREVVHGIDLSVDRGEVHGLVGESGSGKTQTAFAVMGLLSRGGRVLAGSAVFEGNDLLAGGEADRARVRGRGIGYVPQEPMSNLDPSFTIGSQLVEPLRVCLGMDRRAARARALGLLERVGIPDPERTFSAYPHQVSGGMAQRVLIAGAVSTEPALLIADEPTTALDVTVQAEVLDLLRDLQQDLDMGVLLVTHNFGVVADLCDRVSVMRSGHIVESGPTREIFRDAEHPYTQSLLDSILDGGSARGPLAPTDRKDVDR